MNRVTSLLSRLVSSKTGLIACTLAIAIGQNIAQNGPSDHPAPKIEKLADTLMKLNTKADFVAAWRAAPAPKEKDFRGKTFEASLPDLGVLAPVSSFITHQLFGGLGGGPWLGKAFDATGGGHNRFTRSGNRVKFAATVGPSAYDGKPCLILDYSAGDSFIWGTLLGMRDELRQVAPGVWLGLGSMLASGGMRNSAPFVLWPAKN